MARTPKYIDDAASDIAYRHLNEVRDMTEYCERYFPIGVPDLEIAEWLDRRSCDYLSTFIEQRLPRFHGFSFTTRMERIDEVRELAAKKWAEMLAEERAVIERDGLGVKARPGSLLDCLIRKHHLDVQMAEWRDLQAAKGA